MSSEKRHLCECLTCGLTWDDAIVTSMTPVPSARCPFEAFHEYTSDGDTGLRISPHLIPEDWPVRPVTLR